MLIQTKITLDIWGGVHLVLWPRFFSSNAEVLLILVLTGRCFLLPSFLGKLKQFRVRDIPYICHHSISSLPLSFPGLGEFLITVSRFIFIILLFLLAIQALNHPNKMRILQSYRKDTQVLLLLHPDSSSRFSRWMFENSRLRLLLSLLPMLHTGFSDAQHWNLPPDSHVVFRSKVLEGQLPQIPHSTPNCHQLSQMEIYHHILSQLRGRNKICTLIPLRCVASLQANGLLRCISIRDT